MRARISGGRELADVYGPRCAGAHFSRLCIHGFAVLYTPAMQRRRFLPQVAEICGHVWAEVRSGAFSAPVHRGMALICGPAYFPRCSGGDSDRSWKELAVLYGLGRAYARFLRLCIVEWR